MEPSGVIDSGGTPLLGPPARHRWLPPLLTAILLSACGPSSPTSGPTVPPGPSTTPAASATPAATPAPSAAPTAAAGPFEVVGERPIIRRGFVPDRGAVLPGAIAIDGDTYHAWVIAFGDPPGTQDVHHLISHDAVAWTLADDPSLESLSDGLGNPGALPTSVLFDGERWVMYLTGTLATEREGWEIWRATAPGPDGPWTRGDAPVVRRGPAGAWDSGGLDFPTVLRTADGYVMVYSGIDHARPGSGWIGRATSDDGITWTKHDDPATTDAELAQSDPVAEPGLCGGFDERAIYQPRALVDGDRLVMAYAGYSGPLDSRATVGLAASDDNGLTWTCLGGPALSAANLPSGFVHTLTAFRRGGRPALLVEWFTNNGTDVWLAEADALP